MPGDEVFTDAFDEEPVNPAQMPGSPDTSTEASMDVQAKQIGAVVKYKKKELIEALFQHLSPSDFRRLRDQDFSKISNGIPIDVIEGDNDFQVFVYNYKTGTYELYRFLLIAPDRTSREWHSGIPDIEVIRETDLYDHRERISKFRDAVIEQLEILRQELDF
jgi:hypothetical protein